MGIHKPLSSSRQEMRLLPPRQPSHFQTLTFTMVSAQGMEEQDEYVWPMDFRWAAGFLRTTLTLWVQALESGQPLRCPDQHMMQGW